MFAVLREIYFITYYNLLSAIPHFFTMRNIKFGSLKK